MRMVVGLDVNMMMEWVFLKCNKCIVVEWVVVVG